MAALMGFGDEFQLATSHVRTIKKDHRSAYIKDVIWSATFHGERCLIAKRAEYEKSNKPTQDEAQVSYGTAGHNAT